MAATPIRIEASAAVPRTSGRFPAPTRLARSPVDFWSPAGAAVLPVSDSPVEETLAATRAPQHPVSAGQPGTATGGGAPGEGQGGQPGVLGAGGGSDAGGGGGGFYGGGGYDAEGPSGEMGGGGGGSSLVPPGGSVTLAAAGAAPQVVISYQIGGQSSCLGLPRLLSFFCSLS